MSMVALDYAFCLKVGESLYPQKDLHAFCSTLGRVFSEHFGNAHCQFFLNSTIENDWTLLADIDENISQIHIPPLSLSDAHSLTQCDFTTWLAKGTRFDALGENHLLFALSARGTLFGCLSVEIDNSIIELSEPQFLTILTVLISSALDSHLQHHALLQEKISHKLTEEKWRHEVCSQNGLLKQLHIMHKISLRLWHSHSLDNMLHTAVYECIHALDFDRMAIFLININTGTLRGTYGTDIHGKVTNEQWYRTQIEEHHHVKSTLDKRQHITIHTNTPLYHNNKEVGQGWNATISLWDSEEPIGWIACDNLLTGTPLKSYHSELLKLLGVTMSQHLIQRNSQDALKKLNLSLEHRVAQRTSQLQDANKRLNQISREDSLTQVPNRRMLDEKLDEEWHRALRYQTPLTLLIVDIDNFKQYNDTYGHALGDQCLVNVAKALSKVERRAGAILARFGGEEFVFLLPGCDIENSKRIAQRALDAINNLKIPNINSPIMPYVTISVGGKTIIPEKSSNQQQLFIDADIALYEAKSCGKNQAFVS